MGAFFKALEDLKSSNPKMSHAVDNIAGDRRTRANPHGISADLEKSADKELENGGELENVVLSHHFLNRPDLHVEADIDADRIRHVMSCQIFKRWHLGDGSYTSGSELADDAVLEDLLGPLDHDAGNILAAGPCHPTRLQGVSGRQGASVWWCWRKDGKPYSNSGEMYMADLALLDNEIDQAERDGMAVELELNREKHPGKLYRPTGLDAFIRNARFRPNTDSPERFGRTHPIQPSTETKGLPEAVNGPIQYADDLPDDAEIRITSFKYKSDEAP